MSDTEGNRKKTSWRRWCVRILVAVVICALALLLPVVLKSDPVRDPLLNWLLDDPELTVSSNAGDFSWWSPVRIDGLQVRSADGRFQASAKSLQASYSWWNLWVQSPALGAFEVEQPDIVIELRGAESPYPEREASDFQPTFAINLRQASVRVIDPEQTEPVFELNERDVNVRIEREKGNRIVIVDAVQLYEREEANAEICDELLRTIAPTLADLVRVSGRFSLELSRLRVPIDVPDEVAARDSRIEGVLSLHNVSTGFQTPLIRGMVELAAEMHGKTLPDPLRVVEDADVRFELRNGRIFHEGLELGLPDIDPNLRLHSSGTVGTDESLDLQVEVPVALVDNDPNVDQSQTATLRITGTIHEPQVERVMEAEEDTVQ